MTPTSCCLLCGGDAKEQLLAHSLEDALKHSLVSSSSPASLCSSCLELASEHDKLKRRLQQLEDEIKARARERTEVKKPLEWSRSSLPGFEHVYPPLDRRYFELGLREFVDSGRCQFCCEVTSSTPTSLGQGEEGEGRLVVAHSCQVAPIPGRPFSCPCCPGAFASFQSRQRHFLARHCRHEEPWLACQACGKGFRLASKLRQHQGACVGGVRHKCKLCEKSFVSRRNLNDHINTSHVNTDDVKKHECSVCGRRFYKLCNLKSHSVSHSSARAHHCPEEGCGSSFKRPGPLAEHLRKVHGGEGERSKRHLCQECGRSFVTVTGLRKHSKRDHSQPASDACPQPRKHSCPTCSKAFRCASDLRAHAVVHTGLRQFACADCGAAFTQKATLKAHRNIHLGTHRCRGCGKCFSRPRYLEQHSRNCSGVKDQSTADQEVAEDKELLSTAEALTRMGSTVTFIRCETTHEEAEVYRAR